MEERTKFVWIVKNVTDTAHMLSDLGSGGFALPPHREVPLHEIFPWTMLEQSRSLTLARQNNIIEERKEIIFPGQNKNMMNINEVKNSQDLEEIKKQLLALQSMIMANQIVQKPIEPEVKTQQFDLEELTNLIVSKIPKQEVIIQQVSDTINKSKIEELEGYVEPSPEDIATKHLTSGDSLSSSIKDGKTQTIKESKSSHNADDMADLLSRSGL